MTHPNIVNLVEEQQRRVACQNTSYSVGEIIHLYEEEEVTLRPEFQRFFVWTLAQKSNLIESILIGIPLPPIFVATVDTGVVEVVDGMQRLSTIMEFCGILRQEDGKYSEPLTLMDGNRLPLGGTTWNSLPVVLQREFKRSRLDVVSLKSHSDPKEKFDLFMRLNTGGTPMTQEDIERCLAVASEKEG